MSGKCAADKNPGKKKNPPDELRMAAYRRVVEYENVVILFDDMQVRFRMEQVCDLI